MNAVSLFSGALGLDLGFENAGFDIRLAAELDPKACETIRANRPDLNLFEGDVATLSGEDIFNLAGIEPGELTVLFGGAPCQSFSTAGKRRSFDDARGNLVLEFLRLIHETRPDYFVLENVRGLLSAAISHRPLAERGDDFPALQADEQPGSVMNYIYEMLNTLGYTAHHQLLMAADYGVPQIRQRVFMIGSRNGELVPFPRPTHTKQPDLFSSQTWRTLGDALADLQQETVEAPQLNEKTLKYLKYVPPGGYWKDIPDALQAEALGGAYNSSGGRVGFFRRLSFDKPAPTLVTSPNQKATMMCHPTEDRPLSVKEYARIQQFPDDWVFTGNMTSRYRQIGNAVPVGLAYAVATALKQHIEQRHQLEKAS